MLGFENQTNHPSSVSNFHERRKFAIVFCLTRLDHDHANKIYLLFWFRNFTLTYNLLKMAIEFIYIILNNINSYDRKQLFNILNNIF